MGTATQPTPSPLPTTSTPPGPTPSSREFLDTSHGPNKSLKLRTHNQALTLSTGSPRVPSLQSRTRDHADHAGPSPQLVLSKVLTSLPLASSFPSLSRNLSTATTTAPRAATVAPWRVPSTGGRPTRPILRVTTNTLARPELPAT